MVKRGQKEITAYRPCVGTMLINRDGLVWMGRRFEKKNDDGIGKWWQMPQGGIDAGEDPQAAAIRELHEETGVTSARVIAEAPSWLTYDLPGHLIGKSWNGKYRGQKQKWFAFEFLGADSEINLTPPGHKQEFDAWAWMTMDEAVETVVPFKQPVYRTMIAALRHLGK